jgi:8-oxo-dGTP pyrophosphatase MutT (NUDIX family)
MEKHFTATCYIIHEEKILLHLHEKIGKWLPPGGHIEKNELPHEAAIRETKEESGLTVAIISDDPVWINEDNAHSIPRPWMMLEEKIPAHKDVAEHRHIDTIYKAEIVDGKPNPDFQWFSLDEVEQLDNLFDETRNVIRTLLTGVF